MKLSLFIYDIPESTEFPNPSGTLRRRALRINLSCWVVEEGRTPWNLINRMSSAKCNVHLLPFSEEATPELLRMAVADMARELRDAAARERASLKRLDERLRQVESDPTNGDQTIDKARREHSTRREAVLKRTEKLTRDLQAAAESFGLDVSNLPFGDSIARVVALRQITTTRAELYAGMVDALPESDPVAMAAREDEGNVPASILADYIEERTDVDTTAARSAFAPNGTATLAPPVTRASYTFTVRTRNGMRRVESDLTLEQAREICRDLDDEFPRSLARNRFLSPNQLAWLHVLAVEARQREQEEERAAVQSEPVIVSPSPARRNGADDNVPGEPAVQFTVSTEHMVYLPAIKTLQGDHSDLGSPAMRKGTGWSIYVRSHRTGGIKLFRFLREEWSPTDDEMTGWLFAAEDGTSLRVVND